MQKVKEGESFKCEGCGKEWRVLTMVHGNPGRHKCGNEEMAKTVPAWAGCGHVNTFEVDRSK